MPAADGDGDGGGCSKHQRASFRCLDAARYTVAAVVTVLIVTVSVIAVKLLLRPESLRLSVVGGVVYSTPLPAAHQQKAVTLSLNLRAENPSGRARMYLLNATAYLFDNATLATTTPAPEDDSFIFFLLVDEAVRQQFAVYAWKDVEGTEDSMDSAHLDTLCTEGGVIADATLRVDGSVVTEVRSGVNRTRLATYFCRPLLVGAKQGGDTVNDDVLCTEKDLASQDQSAA